MDIYEKEYRRVSNCIGLSLLIFVFMFYGTNIAASLLSSFFTPFLSEKLAYSLESILLMIAYLSSFVVPALILRGVLKKKGIPQDMKLGFNVSRGTWLLIPAGIALTLSASYLNSILLGWFDISETYSMLFETGYSYAPYQILLLLVSSALVPAFCEEFFFRGAILSNLMPYGQGVAVIGSAVLFGLMHQNPYQILYATVAGIILGYVYVKTKSIWCGTLIHFFNNAFSVVQEVVYANAGEGTATVVVAVMDIAILVIGAACLVIYLMADARREKLKRKNGSFGIIIDESDTYEMKPIPAKSKLKCFFSPCMIAASVVLIVSIFATLAMLVMVSGMGALI